MSRSYNGQPGGLSSKSGSYDLVCFSHLRWNSVFQRPQHLMTRFAARGRVFFIEEPVTTTSSPAMDVHLASRRLLVATPRLPWGLDDATNEQIQRRLIDGLFSRHLIRRYVLWYYTPMALPSSRHLTGALATIYDCMDELSAFKDAPSRLSHLERELLARADLVFTGGHSLYEAKRAWHSRAYALPSSVDLSHFTRARSARAEPADQAAIARPRIGYFGVIDERMDLELLAAIADARPEWQLVLVGPVAKIDPATLPKRPNIHYLGQRSYDELPSYLGGWDVAILPFALNESTRFISPTKTPEYLAGGRPVVSTPITDVVRPYGELDLVRIAGTPSEFVAAIEATMSEEAASRIRRADAFLANNSWERTWGRMAALIEGAIDRSRRELVPGEAAAVPATAPAD
jgi:glycosyltransferase involved in cell wall biosynthesis